MSYSVKVACTVMCLFHLLVANPVPSAHIKVPPHIEETIKYLHSMVNNCTIVKKSDCTATMVPIFYNREENVTLAEISCKAVKSLETIKHTKKHFVENLNTTLFYNIPKDMECTIDDKEQKDLYTALEELLSFFRHCARSSLCK